MRKLKALTLCLCALGSALLEQPAAAAQIPKARKTDNYIKPLADANRFSGVAPAAQSNPPAAESAEARVDKLFAQFDKKDSPGCALAVVREGRVVYKRGYGMADLEHDVTLTPQSILYIGSTAKQFSAASVALLAQQGKLSLDDNVRKAEDLVSSASLRALRV